MAVSRAAPSLGVPPEGRARRGRLRRSGEKQRRHNVPTGAALLPCCHSTATIRVPLLLCQPAVGGTGKEWGAAIFKN